MSNGFGVPSPFGGVETPGKAAAMARLSAWAFALFAAVSVVQAVGVWFNADAAYEPYRGGTTGFSIVLAGVTAGLALWQWKKPNRILPVFGIAWALYELSAFLTSALVGAPLGAEGVPIWSPYVSVAAMAACLVLHVGGLRGASAQARMGLPGIRAK